MIEEWKKIPGWNYSVSPDGLVRNDETEKILKPIDAGNGYYRVRLYKDKKGRAILLHRLVATAFVPNPKGKPEVNHIDGNPANNAAHNLEWCTKSENSLHKCRVLGGYSYPWKKLCKPVECVETGKRYESLESAARAVGDHRPNIARAIKRNIRAGGYHWRWATSSES